MTKKIEPLRARTMTLHELQMRTADFIRQVRFQFTHIGYEEEGMSDQEFIENILEPFEDRIYFDLDVLRRARKQKNRLREGPGGA